ncbi:prepilin-type N-terminal cleavage/methylation domain-containing protein [Luteolibacter ambystomatis]|uniref:Prepilin-type N-terminal cleavage/methylation domain-containing protein n=1 Tax=Luteolibacter ambystomatis TaxID=2824561 RepID=A0A975J0M3_9BACT|nr:prepilin-type N-terminal cleavage/methylation domain-containing protein [Luteolibacter ambystomatis]QUE51838.1 prepilin-type N-terminal cleavage/methylation domain-containing protein [Luteolibacter ambystomatis]
MKTNTIIAKSKKGMTLLELTVVILVLLSLISILFIGARAWKKGSDRAGCLMNIRNVQQAIRSYGNMQALTPGATIPASKTATQVLIGSGLFMENAPTCPGNGTYAGLDGTTIPNVGSVLLTCNFADGPAHTPTNTGDW